MKMPVLFVGHGSPAYALEDNPFTPVWHTVGQSLPKPKAILMVSAHWYTKGSFVSFAQKPETIYDFYGFAPELYRVTYPAPGAPSLAARVREVLGAVVQADDDYGLDHGAWCVLRFLYPEANIPVCQLSVDGALSPAKAYEMGKALSRLREEGVLIVGSGNIVHNLRRVDFDRSGGYDWAERFDAFIHDAITAHRFEDAVNFASHPDAALAVPSKDHYHPLLYVLGAAEGTDNINVFNKACVMGSLSMTGYVFTAE